MPDQKLNEKSTQPEVLPQMTEGKACPLFPPLSPGVYTTCGKGCAFFVVQCGQCAFVSYLSSAAKLARSMVADRFRAAEIKQPLDRETILREAERLAPEMLDRARTSMRAINEKNGEK